VREISLPQKFETQTVQPLANRYIKYTIPAATEWAIEETRTVTKFYKENLERKK